MAGLAFYIGTPQHADRSLGQFETMAAAIEEINRLKRKPGENAKDLCVYHLPVDREEYQKQLQDQLKKKGSRK